MNLTSCDNCGVVLDKDKLDFPDISRLETIDPMKAMWDEDSCPYVPFVRCPVCGTGVKS